MQMIWYYLSIVNSLTFLLYGIDKSRAKKGLYRISEVTLLGTAFLGGSMGAWIAMTWFRHKTKHWKFKILVPLFFFLQAAVLLYITMI